MHNGDQNLVGCHAVVWVSVGALGQWATALGSPGLCCGGPWHALPLLRGGCVGCLLTLVSLWICLWPHVAPHLAAHERETFDPTLGIGSLPACFWLGVCMKSLCCGCCCFFLFSDVYFSLLCYVLLFIYFFCYFCLLKHDVTVCCFCTCSWSGNPT